MSSRLENVLALMDLSVPGIHAAWRAARIARANGASLHLLEQLSGLDNNPSSRYGPSSPVARSRSDLAHLAAEIGSALDIKVTHSVCTRDGPQSVTQLARAADLVVIARQAQRGIGDWLRGDLAERLLREAGVTVLIVQRPSGVNYRRALAAVDRAQGPERLLAAALCVGASEVEVASMANDRTPAQALVVRERELAAALIVIGKSSRPWWVDWAKGSLATGVLTRVRCDVLWVPVPVPATPGATSASPMTTRPEGRVLMRSPGK